MKRDWKNIKLHQYEYYHLRHILTLLVMTIEDVKEHRFKTLRDFQF